MTDEMVLENQNSSENLKHITVLREETVAALQVIPGGTYVDCTLGGGGHASLICQQLQGEGTLIGIDQDTFALEKAGHRLEPYGCSKIFVHDSFFNLAEILKAYAPNGVDGICFDLGVSSFQFDDAERGFSYHHDGPLDMRMDRRQKISAYDVVNTYDQDALIRILRDYGEEQYALAIAKKMVKMREEAPITTTLQLAELVREAYPAKMRYKDKHPARKTFQAIRIEVNRELLGLESALQAAIAGLKPQGRLAVITFHSLEDRLVKQFFKQQCDPCTCPPEFPICVCGKKPTITSITRKPLIPTEKELEVNRRARSAKLRIVERLADDKG